MKKLKKKKVEELRSEYGEEEASTADISDDIMLQILNHLSTKYQLSNVAFVCRRWSRLCQSQVRDITPPVTLSTKKISEKHFMSYIFKHAATIETLHLGAFMGLQLDSSDFTANFPRLRDLAISCSASATIGIVKNLPSTLLALSVDASEFPQENTIDSEFFIELQARCSGLEKLELSSVSFRSTDTKVFHSAIQKLSSLATIDIFGPELEWSDVKEIFESCRSLSHFFVCSPRLIRIENSMDQTMIFGSFPPHLVALRLYNQRHLSTSLISVYDLFQNSGHQIQVLHAQGSYSSNIQIISRFCSNLRVLDLSAMNTENGLTPLEENILCELPDTVKMLERVCISAATDKIFIKFALGLPHLVEFRLQCIRKVVSNVSDRAVRALVEGCDKLEILSLHHCSKITSSSVRAIAYHLHSTLKVLHLNDCKLLLDDAIPLIFPRLNNTLRLLDVDGCLISFSTLQYIQAHKQSGSSLRILSISRALWRRHKKWINENTSSVGALSIKAGAPYHWSGFYHAPDFSSL